MILVQIPIEDRFVMCDPVSKSSQAVEFSLHFLAVAARKRPVQSRTPKRPVVVRPAAAIDRSAATDKADPEARRHRCHELTQGRFVPTAPEEVRHAVICAFVKPSGTLGVQLAAVLCLKLDMHGVSHGNLKSLQQSMKRDPNWAFLA